VTPQEELALLLRPAAGGLYLVSSGRAAQLAVQRRLYGATTEAEVRTRFHESLERIADARAIVLGVPSDVGAGFQRGANLGPQGIRTTLLDTMPSFPERARTVGLVDIGDVVVVPQLLHGDMLSDGQKAASRKALYPGVPEEIAARLPVSPLSIAERALDLVFEINPGVAPIVLGGDHSTAMPVARALARLGRKRPWGIVQSDAHTDLLEERLGVTYCFATWSYHANELLGRGRLVSSFRNLRTIWQDLSAVAQAGRARASSGMTTRFLSFRVTARRTSGCGDPEGACILCAGAHVPHEAAGRGARVRGRSPPGAARVGG
jgi:arginase family enzyme